MEADAKKAVGLENKFNPPLDQPVVSRFAMRRLIFKLIGSKKVRTTIKFLRLHSLGNWWLHCFPVARTLPGTGIRYRARRVESLALASEMFDEGTVYTTSNLPANIRTFADLGCNVGYFTCWLCHQLRSTQLKGLMVDANAEAVEDARWQIATNHLRDVRALHGLVGVNGNGGQASFFVHAANVCSTAVPSVASLNETNTWTRIQVPCVSVEENWRTHFGDERCDLLKVDIEGSELDFFRNETDFLKRVGTIVVEWHKSRVSFAEMENFLSGQNFSAKSILCDQPQYGIAVFSRKEG
jgi:FkbM family methyltransferase